MKKAVTVLLLLGMLCCGLYAFWVSQPPWPGAPLVQQAVAHQQTVESERQAAVNNPKQNGYLEPALKPLWDESQQNSAALAACTKMASYGTSHSELLDVMTSAWQRQEPEFVQACSAFEPLLGPLQKAAARPFFVVPGVQVEPGSATRGLRLRLRAAAQAVLAWGQLQMLKGHPEQTLQSNLSVLNWGHTVAVSAVSPAHVALGLELRGLAQNALGALLWQQGSVLSAADLRALLSSLEAARVSRDTVRSSFEAELALLEQAHQRDGGRELGNSLAARTEEQPDHLLLSLPGVGQREVRIAEGLLARDLVAWSAQPDAPPAAPSFSRWGWLTGQVPLRSVTSSPDRLQRDWSNSERRLAFLRLTAQLWLFRAEHGAFPATLSELAGQPEPLLPAADLHYDTHSLTFRPSGEPSERVVAAAGTEAWNTTSLPVWIARLDASVADPSAGAHR